MKLIIMAIMLSGCATKIVTTTFKTDFGLVSFKHGNDETIPSLFIKGKYYVESKTEMVIE